MRMCMVIKLPGMSKSSNRQRIQQPKSTICQCSPHRCFWKLSIQNYIYQYFAWPFMSWHCTFASSKELHNSLVMIRMLLVGYILPSLKGLSSLYNLRTTNLCRIMWSCIMSSLAIKKKKLQKSLYCRLPLLLAVTYCVLLHINHNVLWNNSRYHNIINLKYDIGFYTWYYFHQFRLILLYCTSF